MFAGLSVIVDRESGAQRELLAAPIPRPLLVVGNLIVAFAITAFQVAVLIAAAVARGIHFDATAGGIAWFVASGALLTIGMYGPVETLAARIPRAEEYIARLPAIAIVPWFLAGSLFPITALPHFLTWIARFLPLTHALALVRHGLLDDPSGLAQHLAAPQHDRHGRAQPARRRRLCGPTTHDSGRPRLLAHRRPLTCGTSARSKSALRFVCSNCGVSRRAARSPAVLAVVACLAAAPVSSADRLGWNENAKYKGKSVMSYQVASLTVTASSWSARVSFHNLSRKTIRVGNEFGLGFWSNDTATGLTQAIGFATATKFSSRPPAVLKPGGSWSGVIGGSGQLAGGTRVYARVVFGPFNGFPGQSAAVVWITDHAKPMGTNAKDSGGVGPVI
jgi:hypothetical protein